MRDTRRIKKFCDEFAKIWEENCPDWRFGQMICNVFGSFDIDPFFPEEDKMLSLIAAYFGNKEQENATN